MKFVCERCQTRYSIADDKVRQKILKIRCKTCENVITVRDSGAVSGPAASAPPPTPSRAAPPVAEWFVATNGQQVGPLSKTDAAKRIVGAKLDDEVFVWREDFDGWKEPKAVPALMQEVSALRAKAAPPPPPLRPAPPPPVAAKPAAAGHAKPGSAGRATLPPPSRSVPALAAGARPTPAASAPAAGPLALKPAAMPLLEPDSEG